MKSFSVIVAVFVLVVTACKPQNPEDGAPYIPIAYQSLIDAATVKEGSYFLYQDSLSGGIDSYTVYKFSGPSYVYRNTPHAYYEGIGFDSYSGFGTDYKSIGGGAEQNVFSVNISVKEIRPFGVCWRLPFVPGESQYFGISTSTSLQHLDSFTVLGVKYRDVYEMSSYNEVQGDGKMHTWFTPQYGLIKFSVSDSTNHYTYFLKKASIVR